MRVLGTLLLLFVFASTAWAVEVDTDGDHLTDFQERHKYFTDPTRADSDGDGTPDGAWDERREYSYTIRTVVRVMRPVDESALNDDYQDARILEETPTWVKLEVVHYPLNTVAEALAGDPAWRESAKRWPAQLKPGLTSNWDDEMRTALQEGLAASDIDVDALDDRTLVERAAAWLLDRAKYDGDQFTGYFTHFPEGRPAVCPGCEKGIEGYNRAGRSLEEQWARDLFAKGMFQNRTRGSCTSTAIYLNAGLRAIGIPSRIVYCIPVIDASDPSEMLMLAGLRHPHVRKVIQEALGNLGSSWSGHTFNEVFVGERWRRLNYANLGQNSFGPRVFGLLTHVLTANDWSEADAAKTIGVRQSSDRTDDVFGHGNPYSTIELSDRFGIHHEIDVEARGAGEWQALTIKRVVWYASPDRPSSLTTRLGDPEHTGYVLLEVAENHPEGGLAQYRRFWQQVDKDFVLKAEGQADLAAQATRGYWGSGWFFLEIQRAQFEKMATDVPYALVPANAVGKMRWAVAEDVHLVRTDEHPRRPDPAEEATRRLRGFVWSDAPAGRRMIGDQTEMRLAVLAQVEAYDGDFDALKRHQSGGPSTFHLRAEGHPTLGAAMATGGITRAGEAWVILYVMGEPVDGVTYRLHAPDARWVVRGDLPAR